MSSLESGGELELAGTVRPSRLSQGDDEVSSEITIQHLVFDTRDPQLVSAFWSEVLGRAIADDWGDFVRLAPDESGTRLAFAAVPEAKITKNRLHLDIAASNREQAVSRFIALGGSLVETRHQDDHTWSVMADPEGNEFCVA